MELKGQNKNDLDLESNVDTLSTARRVENDYHVVFEGNLDLSPKVPNESDLNPEISLEDAVVVSEQAVLQTEVIQVGNITSGKAFILSFTNSKYKQINQFPFLLRDGTETGSDKDEYYHYNHHWDLREGHDLERIAEEFPEIFPYRARGQFGFDDITEAQYTDLMRYKVYRLIKNGQFVFVEDHKKVYVIWEGNEVRPPVWYIPFEWKDKEREAEEEEAVEETDERVIDVNPVETEPIKEIEFVGAAGEAAAEVAAAAVDTVADAKAEADFGIDFVTENVEIEDPFVKPDAVASTVTIPVSMEEEVPKEVKKWGQQLFVEEIQSEPETGTTQFLLEEVRKLDKRIQNLEQKLNQQTETNKKHQRTISLLVILSVVIAAAGVAINFLI